MINRLLIERDSYHKLMARPPYEAPTGCMKMIRIHFHTLLMRGDKLIDSTEKRALIYDRPADVLPKQKTLIISEGLWLTDEENKYLFMLQSVVDGRSENHSFGLNPEDFARLFTDLGARFAFNPDSGRREPDVSVMLYIVPFPRMKTRGNKHGSKP